MPGVYGQFGATTGAAAIGAPTQVIQSQVVIRAISIGTHSVAIGNDTSVGTASTTGVVGGYILYGNDSVTIPVGFWKNTQGGQATMADIYAIADATTQTICFAGE